MTKEQMTFTDNSMHKAFIQTVLVCASIYEKLMLALRFLIVLKADAKISPQIGRAAGFRQDQTQNLWLAERTGYSRGCSLPVAAAVLARCVMFPVSLLAGCEQTPSRTAQLRQARHSCPWPGVLPRVLPALNPAQGLQ